MHTWHLIAFLFAVAATAAALFCIEGKPRWPIALLAASFACWLLPTALQLTN